MKVTNNLIVQPDASGNWILYNVFTQNTLAVSSEVMGVLSLICQGKSEAEIKKSYKGKTFEIWDIETFSNYEGLLADPTRRLRDYKDWPNSEKLAVLDLIERLEQKRVVIHDEAKYSSSLELKTSILDTDHIGNFHQQLGQKLLIEKRIDPSDWWVNQKFAPGYGDLKDTLYKAIQGKFLRTFFESRFKPSDSVIDVGCGIGYYSKLMGRTGASVLGIDPSVSYIEIAKKGAPKNVSFKLSEIGSPGATDWIESGSFDYVFMSDALLFYFVSPDPRQKPDIKLLFSEIKRILKPQGSFFSMEPHGIFWLRPWLGEVDRPFTILTEYRTKRFNVAPSYGQIIKSFIDNGFIIKDMKELYPEKSFAEKDPQAAGFATEFPLWWFYELKVER